MIGCPLICGRGFMATLAIVLAWLQAETFTIAKVTRFSLKKPSWPFSRFFVKSSSRKYFHLFWIYFAVYSLLPSIFLSSLAFSAFFSLDFQWIGIKFWYLNLKKDHFVDIFFLTLKWSTHCVELKVRFLAIGEIKNS